MAIVAVASVVREKLGEMLKKESALTFGKVIEEIIREADQLSDGLLLRSDEDETVKIWGGDYLRILYELEDVVEITLAVGIARRRRKLRYLFNLTCSLNNLRALRKMKRIATNLKLYTNGNPADRVSNGTRSLSLSSLNLSNGFRDDEEQSHQVSQRCVSMNSYEDDDSEEQEEDDEEQLQRHTRDDDDGDPENGVRRLRRSWYKYYIIV